MPLLETDPNWLPSTLAQSTAALVAIVGGLLVSRLVGLSEERGSLLRRRDELLARRSHVSTQFESTDRERLNRCLDLLERHHLDDVIKAGGSIDIDQALEDFVPRGSTDEEMRPFLEEMAAKVQRIFSEVEYAYLTGIPPDDFKSLRDVLPGADPADREIYEGVAEQVGRRRPSRSLVPFTTAMPRMFIPTPDIVYERHDRAIERTKELRAQIAALDAEIGLLDEQAGRFARPDGVFNGLAVLSFFAALGIVFPMVVMAMRPVPASMPLRAGLIVAFVIGFAVFVAYLVTLVRSLPLTQPAKKAERQNAP
jgi:hypothetical protein